MEITSQLNWYRGLVINEISRSSAKNMLLSKIIISENVDNKMPAQIEVRFHPSDYVDHDGLDKILLKVYEMGKDAIDYLFLAKEITIKIEEIWK
jgi:hypothetical protein